MSYRESCGTARGALAHQTAGEPLCGWCLEAETAARLRAEAVPRRPAPAPGTREECLAPVTPAQAAVNRAVLAAETEAWERDHPGASHDRRSLLRLVSRPQPGSAPRRREAS